MHWTQKLSGARRIYITLVRWANRLEMWTPVHSGICQMTLNQFEYRYILRVSMVNIMISWKLTSQLLVTSQTPICPSLHPVTMFLWSGVIRMADMQCVGGFWPHSTIGTTRLLLVVMVMLQIISHSIKFSEIFLKCNVNLSFNLMPNFKAIIAVTLVVKDFMINAPKRFYWALNYSSQCFCYYYHLFTP